MPLQAVIVREDTWEATVFPKIRCRSKRPARTIGRAICKTLGSHPAYLEEVVTIGKITWFFGFVRTASDQWSWQNIHLMGGQVPKLIAQRLIKLI